MPTLPAWSTRIYLTLLPLLGCGTADPQPTVLSDTASVQDAAAGMADESEAVDTAADTAAETAAAAKCEQYRLRASDNHNPSFSILYGLNAGGKTNPVEGSFQILNSSGDTVKVTLGSLLSSMSFAWHPGDGEWRSPGAHKLALPIAAGAAVPIFVRWAPSGTQELGQLKMTVEDCPPLKADLKGVP